jgi:hypothetical protein
MNTKGSPNMKQYSQACEDNKIPILNILREEFPDAREILEIGSGTGQHAVFFGTHLPHITWQTSDLESSHASINAWLNETALENVLPPLMLDATDRQWPNKYYDGLFSANTTHIMSWSAVENLFTRIGNVLAPNASFCLYGPFNYKGHYTSDSNENFDQWLKDRDPLSGIRDFEALELLARDNGMSLKADHEMPVNNRLLVWEYSGA